MLLGYFSSSAYFLFFPAERDGQAKRDRKQRVSQRPTDGVTSRRTQGPGKRKKTKLMPRKAHELFEKDVLFLSVLTRYQCKMYTEPGQRKSLIVKKVAMVNGNG